MMRRSLIGLLCLLLLAVVGLNLYSNGTIHRVARSLLGRPGKERGSAWYDSDPNDKNGWYAVPRGLFIGMARLLRSAAQPRRVTTHRETSEHVPLLVTDYCTGGEQTPQKSREKRDSSWDGNWSSEEAWGGRKTDIEAGARGNSCHRAARVASKPGV